MLMRVNKYFIFCILLKYIIKLIFIFIKTCLVAVETRIPSFPCRGLRLARERRDSSGFAEMLQDDCFFAMTFGKTFQSESGNAQGHAGEDLEFL